MRSISASDQAKRAAVSFSRADLQPGYRGGASGSTVLIDRDAAGWWWYVEPTPADDAEFASCGGDLHASKGNSAEGRVDLLTAVMHELGHLLGDDDLPVADQPHDLMAENISTGALRPGDARARPATPMPNDHLVRDVRHRRAARA